VDFVRRELTERFSSELLTSEGYSIFTSLDAGLQEIAQRAVKQGLDAANGGRQAQEARAQNSTARSQPMPRRVGGSSYQSTGLATA